MSGYATNTLELELADLDLDDTNALDSLDQRLFIMDDDGELYGNWATRLTEPTDRAGATIRDAIAASGIDDPGFYRLANLLRETQFGTSD